MEAKDEIVRGPMKHNGRGSLELKSSRYGALGERARAGAGDGDGAETRASTGAEDAAGAGPRARAGAGATRARGAVRMKIEKAR